MRDQCGCYDSGSSCNRGLVRWISLPPKSGRKKREGRQETDNTIICRKKLVVITSVRNGAWLFLYFRE